MSVALHSFAFNFLPATWPNLPRHDTATVEFDLVNLSGMTNKDLCHVQSVQGSFPLFYCLVWNTNSCLSLQASMSLFDLRAECIALKRLGVGALFCCCVSCGGIILSRGWLPKVEASGYLQHPTQLLLNTFKCNLKELTTKSAYFASDQSLVWRCMHSGSMHHSHGVGCGGVRSPLVWFM